MDIHNIINANFLSASVNCAVIFSPTNVLIKEDLSFGNLKISPAQRAAFLSDAEIALTTREFDILFFMASHPGQVFNNKSTKILPISILQSSFVEDLTMLFTQKEYDDIDFF